MRTKTFPTYDQDSLLLMPPSLHDWVDPEGLPAFLDDLVDELDLAPFLAAQTKEARGFRRFHLRGRVKVTAEWHLVCAVHNLAKLFRSARAGRVVGPTRAAGLASQPVGG